MRSEHDADVLVVEHAGVGLPELHGLGDGLASRNLDDAVVGERHTVDGDLGTVGIALVDHQEFVVNVLVNLRGVGEAQRVVGCTTRRHIAYHGYIHRDLRHLDLHGGLHDGGARTIILGLHLALIRTRGLSATCAEDGRISTILIYVHSQSVVVAFLSKGVAE